MDTLAKAVEQTDVTTVGTEPTFTVGSKLNSEGQYESHSHRTYKKLMTEFRAVWKDSAETFIKRAEILKKANDELKDNKLDYTFEGFCNELLGMKPEHSTVKKMLVIGKEAGRFYPVLDQLPDNWTTLYELARLDETKFNQVIEDERFSPKMTAKVLGEIFPPESKDSSKVKVLNIVVKVTLAKVDGAKKQDIHDRLQALKADFGDGVEVKGDLAHLAA